MKKRLKMLVCCCLSFAMVFTSIEWSGTAGFLNRVSAAEETKKQEKPAVIEKESTKNSTTFQFNNGKKKTVFYGQDVRFEDEKGNLTDYDPSLVPVKDQKSGHGKNLSKYQYENKKGDKRHYLPKELKEETPVLMENGKYEISFLPMYGQTSDSGEEKKAVQKTEAEEESTDDAQAGPGKENAFASIEKLKRMPLEKEEVLTAEDETKELPVSVSYES